MKNASSVSPPPVRCRTAGGLRGSISSKDGGYYTTEAAAQESYATGRQRRGQCGQRPCSGENAAEAATDETAQKIIYNASLSMESTDFDDDPRGPDDRRRGQRRMAGIHKPGTAPRKTMTVPPTTPCGCRGQLPRVSAAGRRGQRLTSARAPRTSRAAT